MSTASATTQPTTTLTRTPMGQPRRAASTSMVASVMTPLTITPTGQRRMAMITPTGRRRTAVMSMESATTQPTTTRTVRGTPCREFAQEHGGSAAMHIAKYTSVQDKRTV
jgi:hypothetical protein